MSVAKFICTTVSNLKRLFAALAKAAEATHVSTAWAMRDALPLCLGQQDGLAVELASGPCTDWQSGKKWKSA